jgi:hypothetical protein
MAAIAVLLMTTESCSGRLSNNANPTDGRSSGASNEVKPTDSRSNSTSNAMPPTDSPSSSTSNAVPPTDSSSSLASLPSNDLNPTDAFGPGWRVNKSGKFGAPNVRVVTDGPVRMLEVMYPKGSASPSVHRKSHREIGGFQAYMAPQDWQAVDEATLKYRVRFEPGFDFVRGGKLPGLYGGIVTSGGDIPDGTNGWSTRLMWREEGQGEVYAYLPTSTVHGTSLGRGSWRFGPDRWISIEQHVRLNTPGVADGLIEIVVDGVRVLRVSDVVFRSVSSLKIEGVFFSTFFGGDDTSWATPRTVRADFADLSLAHA